MDPEHNSKSPDSVYTAVACPSCQQSMWLGARSQALVEAKEAIMLCALCAGRQGFVTSATELKVLADET